MDEQAFRQLVTPVLYLVTGVLLIGAVVMAGRAVLAKRVSGQREGLGLAVTMVLIAITLPLLPSIAKVVPLLAPIFGGSSNSSSESDTAGTSTPIATPSPAVQTPAVELAVPPANPPAREGTNVTTVDFSGVLWSVAAVVVIVLALVALVVGAGVLRRRHRAAATAMATARQQWNRTVADHDELSQEFLQIETDVMARVTMPTFWDHSRPASSAWWMAEAAARDTRTESMPDASWREKYRAAVTHAQVTFRAAVAAARRTGLSAMTPEDRRKVETARRALAIVLDDAAPEAERRTALRVALDNLTGLVDLPAQMRKELSSATRRQLASTGLADF